MCVCDFDSRLQAAAGSRVRHEPGACLSNLSNSSCSAGDSPSSGRPAICPGVSERSRRNKADQLEGCTIVTDSGSRIDIPTQDWLLEAGLSSPQSLAGASEAFEFFPLPPRRLPGIHFSAACHDRSRGFCQRHSQAAPSALWSAWALQDLLDGICWIHHSPAAPLQAWQGDGG